MRIVFFGTPDFAVPALRAVHGAGHEIVAVYTQPPRPAGRGMALRRSPVHDAGEVLGLDVRVPQSLKSGDEQSRLEALEADAGVVVAYGQILPAPVLDSPRHGMFNIHASLLPRWRGAAPVNRAVMAGDTEAGVSIMRVTEGLDEGPVCLAKRVGIGPDMSAGDLHDALASLGAEAMVACLSALQAGTLRCEAQNAAAATYAAKLTNAETRIDWTRPAQDVHNHIRGLAPYPGAWFEIASGEKRERVKALGSALVEGGGVPGTVLDDRLTVACAEGAVRLTRVQRAGKKLMSATDFLRGVDLAPGMRLS